jgi:hypothetical protein
LKFLIAKRKEWKEEKRNKNSYQSFASCGCRKIGIAQHDASNKVQPEATQFKKRQKKSLPTGIEPV